MMVFFSVKENGFHCLGEKLPTFLESRVCEPKLMGDSENGKRKMRH